GDAVLALVRVAVGLLGGIAVLVAVAAGGIAVAALARATDLLVAVGVGLTSARHRATKSAAVRRPSPLTSAVEQSLLPTNTAPASAPTSAELTTPSQLASPTTVCAAPAAGSTINAVKS